MRKLFTIMVAVILTASVLAQSPEKMSYQAVIRDGSNNLVTNHAVGMQISILQGSPSGTAVYVEIQTPLSNANGLVSLEIGNGTVVSGDFTAIDWANGPYFIKTETDPAGGASYTITGTSQLLSVPYALHSKTAETITETIVETDPVYSDSQAANITATDITNLGNLSGTNTGDQDISALATKTALGDSTAQVRNEIPDVSGFLTSETDPTFTSSMAANITASDITNLGNLSGNNAGDQHLSVSSIGDTLYLSNSNWVIIPGISSSNQVTVTVTDIDGNVYKTVKIGNQVWMAENLKTTQYADGTPIVNGTLLGNIGYTDKYYFIYQNDPSYKDTYGLLYTWSAATNGVNGSANPSGVQGVCPTGWHVPSNAEKTELITYLGGSDIAGGKMKEIGTSHWSTPNTGATNESGFTALGTGGFFYQTAHRYEYMLFGQGAWIWTATTNPNHVDQTTAYAIVIGYNSDDAPIDNARNKGDGMSVRCVKD